MSNYLKPLLDFISSHDGINDKGNLSELITSKFSLTQDRSVYYCADFALRFSSSQSESFGNTVLSLSNLQKVDDRPFIVCLVTPTKNYPILANSTFLKKLAIALKSCEKIIFEGASMALTSLESSRE